MKQKYRPCSPGQGLSTPNKSVRAALQMQRGRNRKYNNNNKTNNKKHKNKDTEKNLTESVNEKTFQRKICDQNLF